MIGSPDLLAFTGTEGFGGGEEDQDAIPEELSVPLLPPSNPWTSSAQFHRDFILVAEFSEQVCDFTLDNKLSTCNHPSICSLNHHSHSFIVLLCEVFMR